MKKFNSDFMLGAATAGHQVEGNNTNSDCWALEHMKYSSYVEPSLDAVDHYNRFKEDILLMKNAGLNCYRFSIEWSRLEPQEGKFDDNEINHYLDVIHCCKENGIEPFVTMHHFASPKWLISKGGWEAESTVEYFARYCKYVVERIGDHINYICTINEANMGLQIAAIMKRYILQINTMAAKSKDAAKNSEGTVQLGLNLEALMASQQSAAIESATVFGVDDPSNVQVFAAIRTNEGDALVMRSHQAAKSIIKTVCPHIQVGVTLSLHDMQTIDGGEELARKEWDDEFLHYLPYIKDDDFLGVQNYTRSIIGKNGLQPTKEDAELTQMNYEFYPEALENVIRKVAQDFKGDIFVTENGIATGDDTRRIEFIRRALNGVHNCIDDGLPIKGYMHWSLLDNFEWQKGYAMTFGLIAVDRTTQKRIPKPSLDYLGSMKE